MIPLLPLLVLAPHGQPRSAPPAWLAALLRDAPPSLRMPPPVIRRPDGSLVPPPGGVHVGIGSDDLDLDPSSVAASPPPPAPDAKPAPWKVLQKRASALIAQGKVEEAYRIEKAGHEDDDELFDVDRLPDAALLTGRYAEAQRLLVQKARLYGSGWSSDRLRLSLASAAQGRVYPGQGAWVLGEARERLAWQYGPDGLAARYGDLARYPAPTAPADVAALSVLALGLVEHEPAYLEWALRLDPRCAPAGTDLVDLYAPRRPADAIRVAASMVKALPSGPARERFAARLKALKASASGTTAPPKG